MDVKYTYGEVDNIDAPLVFLCILTDTFMEHLGVNDMIAVVAVILGQPILPTRGIFVGATKGTSIYNAFVTEEDRLW